jgi:hypothetical protein
MPVFADFDFRYLNISPVISDDIINIAVRIPATTDAAKLRFRLMCLCFFIFSFLSFEVVLSALSYCNIKKMQEQPTHFSKENVGRKNNEKSQKLAPAIAKAGNLC